MAEIADRLVPFQLPPPVHVNFFDNGTPVQFPKTKGNSSGGDERPAYQTTGVVAPFAGHNLSAACSLEERHSSGTGIHAASPYSEETQMLKRGPGGSTAQHPACTSQGGDERLGVKDPTTCPRCGNGDIKFSYYNNHNVNQPRYFCRGCQRHWTHGGCVRANVPVGAGSRKRRRTHNDHKGGVRGVQSSCFVERERCLTLSGEHPTSSCDTTHAQSHLQQQLCSLASSASRDQRIVAAQVICAGIFLRLLDGGAGPSPNLEADSTATRDVGQVQEVLCHLPWKSIVSTVSQQFPQLQSVLLQIAKSNSGPAAVSRQNSCPEHTPAMPTAPVMPAAPAHPQQLLQPGQQKPVLAQPQQTVPQVPAVVVPAPDAAAAAFKPGIPPTVAPVGAYEQQQPAHQNTMQPPPQLVQSQYFYPALPGYCAPNGFEVEALQQQLNGLLQSYGAMIPRPTPLEMAFQTAMWPTTNNYVGWNMNGAPGVGYMQFPGMYAAAPAQGYPQCQGDTMRNILQQQGFT